MISDNEYVVYGSGRIGKQLFLQLHEKGINRVTCIDPFIQTEYLCYSLNFDSIYGRRSERFQQKDNRITDAKGECEIVHLKDLPRHLEGSIAIDATGKEDVPESIRSKHQRIYVTNSSIASADQYVISGTSDRVLSSSQIVSVSICDATALVCIMDVLSEQYGIKHGHITTLHPWLNYQNLSDAPVPKTSASSGYIDDYALGRKSTETLIPKSTTAVDAISLCRPYGAKLTSNSFRVPTPIISAAIASIALNNPVMSKRDFIQQLTSTLSIELVDRRYVSSDMIGNKAAAIVDTESIKISSDKKQINLNLWYDNEAGYVANVVNLITETESS